MTPSIRAASLTSGALLLVAAVVAAVLAVPATSLPYVLLALLLIPVGVLSFLKVWEHPVLGVAGSLALIAVPWSTGEEGQAFAHFGLPDFATVVLVGIVAVRTLVLGDRGRLRSWVVLPLAGIVLAGGAATLTATDPVASVSGLIRFTQIFVAVPLATYLAIQSRKDLWLILAAILALGVFEGAIGAYQFLSETGASYGETSVRAVGTFGAYNILAMAAVVGYAMIAAAAIFAGFRGESRLWGLALLVALAFPLAFSLSRGFWISAAVGVAVVATLASRRGLAYLLLAGGLTGAIVAGIAGNSSSDLAERFNDLSSAKFAQDQSVRDRYAMWHASQKMWEDHPLTGVGIKNFSHFRDAYASTSFSGGSDIGDPGSDDIRRVELLSPHSLYWLILAEQGLVGALAYGALFFSLGLAGLKRLRGLGKPSVEKVFGLLSLGFLASYLVGGIYTDVGGSTMPLGSVLLGGLIWLASGAKVDEEVDEEVDGSPS